MQCKPAISSMSLGRAWVHELPAKLDAAAASGLEGVEIFHEDLQYLAESLPGGMTLSNRLAAAKQIRKLCDDRSLSIICLQPFLHSEGLRDRSRRAKAMDELHVWFQLAHILGTDLIQTPASFLPESEISGDVDLIVSDYREMADLGAAQNPPFNFAFESLCFSTYINTWEQCWDVIQRVDRPNFGICFDTYNIAGKIFADPAAASGKVADAEAETKASIERLVKTVDVAKVFFIQVVDGERLSSPLVEGHEFYAKDQPARMSWSRNCRLFYAEADLGAYLPVQAITKAIINGLGFKGWVSMELFNRSMNEADEQVPAKHAKRAMDSWWRIVDDCALQYQPPTKAASSQTIEQKNPTVTAVSVQSEVSML